MAIFRQFTESRPFFQCCPGCPGCPAGKARPRHLPEGFAPKNDMTTKTKTPSLKKSIVLVGLMGSGKSSVGARLADGLALPFIDADKEIEKAAGCSVLDIFELYGEPAFRDGERKVIGRLLDGPVTVLATGGGAFMDPDTRDIIEKKAISVWIRADLETLVKRTARKGGRPLLKGQNPRKVLEGLMVERHPVYTLANITVDTDNEPPETTAQKITDALNSLDVQNGTNP